MRRQHVAPALPQKGRLEFQRLSETVPASRCESSPSPSNTPKLARTPHDAYDSHHAAALVSSRWDALLPFGEVLLVGCVSAVFLLALLAYLVVSIESPICLWPPFFVYLRCGSVLSPPCCLVSRCLCLSLGFGCGFSFVQRLCHHRDHVFTSLLPHSILTIPPRLLLLTCHRRNTQDDTSSDTSFHDFTFLHFTSQTVDAGRH